MTLDKNSAPRWRDFASIYEINFSFCEEFLNKSYIGFISEN